LKLNSSGATISDLLLGVAPPESLSLYALTLLTEAISNLISLLSGAPYLPQDALAAQGSLSTAGALKFNAAPPGGAAQ
jgi:triacylglycerol lipase